MFVPSALAQGNDIQKLLTTFFLSANWRTRKTENWAIFHLHLRDKDCNRTIFSLNRLQVWGGEQESNKNVSITLVESIAHEVALSNNFLSEPNAGLRGRSKNNKIRNDICWVKSPYGTAFSNNSFPKPRFEGKTFRRNSREQSFICIPPPRFVQGGELHKTIRTKVWNIDAI